MHFLFFMILLTLFFLVYFIVRIQDIIHATYKTKVNQQLMSSVRLCKVSRRLLIVDFWVNHSFLRFGLLRGWYPYYPPQYWSGSMLLFYVTILGFLSPAGFLLLLSLFGSSPHPQLPASLNDCSLIVFVRVWGLRTPPQMIWSHV